MSPTSYQLHHPWHWLTYGNNATAAATLSAVFGLIGLFLYVWYTKRIMDATLNTLQTGIYPVLFPQLNDIEGGKVHWTVSNLGNGPARNVSVWRIEEGNDAVSLLGKWQVLPKNERRMIYGTLLPNHPKGEAFKIRYPSATGEDAFLVIIEAEDNAGTRHQLQILSFGEESSRGRLNWEPYTLTMARKKAARKSRKNSRLLVHGKGKQIGVDLNLFHADGTPYKPRSGGN